jgi:hypothetical protein
MRPDGDHKQTIDANGDKWLLLGLLALFVIAGLIPGGALLA